MNGVLIPDLSTSPALAEVTWRLTDGWSRRLALLEQLIAGLRDEVAELREENAELRRENAALKQEAGYWKAMHARAVEREAELAAELETARGEIRKLQDRLFGRK
jgi:regulator of replication initiation timing